MIRDYTLNMLIVALHQCMDILWVKCFLKCGGLRHIGEENTYQLSFLWKRCSCLGRPQGSPPHFHTASTPTRTRLYRYRLRIGWKKSRSITYIYSSCPRSERGGGR